MDVILLRDVENVGLRGEVVSVSRGFMRNYLEPRKLAETATPARVAEVQRREAERAKHEARPAERGADTAGVSTRPVLGVEVNAGPRGTVCGSASPAAIADGLWGARKIRVDRGKIDRDEPIKRVGRYEVPIDVFE